MIKLKLVVLIFSFYQTLGFHFLFFVLVIIFAGSSYELFILFYNYSQSVFIPECFNASPVFVHNFSESLDCPVPQAKVLSKEEDLEWLEMMEQYGSRIELDQSKIDKNVRVWWNPLEIRIEWDPAKRQNNITKVDRYIDLGVTVGILLLLAYVCIEPKKLTDLDWQEIEWFFEYVVGSL